VINWAFGVTTVPERRKTTLPLTLASLAAAGFPAPHLFVDGERDAVSWRDQFRCGATARWPKLRAYGNWCLALAELYILNPAADRFALFQDDVLAVKDLRAYLDSCPLPPFRYWNLITYPRNAGLAGKREGWFPSAQRGWGAQGYVFGVEGVVAMLSSRYMAERPRDPRRGHLSIDGGVSCAFRKEPPGKAKERWIELCHMPTLLRHQPGPSAIGNPEQPNAAGWRGEGWSALEMVKG
jgi:hypothetical protein